MICPLIQSMVVVTSPMGVQAPPALAAMTTRAPKSLLASTLGTSLRRSEIMTMVVVRLSSTEDMTKARMPMVHMSPFLEVVLMKSVTTRKPW